MTDTSTKISQRKAEHLRVASSGEADFRVTTLLEQVHLVHQSLPELALDGIDLSVQLFDRELAAPLVISGMTGGTPEAGQINKDLARAAQAAGIAFGVGSQRAMAEHPELEATFAVRDVAPEVLLIGNIGAVQARQLGVATVTDLARRIGADAMAVHLNPAQELIQERGDRDFTGIVDMLHQLVDALAIPVVVKETGCGLSPRAARRIAAAGVRTVDVSGAGGTSWVAVEARRATQGSAAARLGEELWDWGLPTAVSVAACAAAGLEVIATGGLRNGLDVARALALGARCGGLAAPVLRAHQRGGCDAVTEYLDELVRSIRAVTLLSGCQSVGDLARAPRHLGGELRTWLDDLGLR